MFDHGPQIEPTSWVQARRIFKRRCDVGCAEWRCGKDLHDVVDALQAYAEHTGLIAMIGQDRVQSIMAEAFKSYRKQGDGGIYGD